MLFGTIETSQITGVPNFPRNALLVGLRSAEGLDFSHDDGGLGWLRGWLVSGQRRGWFLATV